MNLLRTLCLPHFCDLLLLTLSPQDSRCVLHYQVLATLTGPRHEAVVLACLLDPPISHILRQHVPLLAPRLVRALPVRIGILGHAVRSGVGLALFVNGPLL